MKDIKEYLEKVSKLLPVNKSISLPEAERRAGEFLVALAYIADVKHVFAEDKIRALSVQSAIYHELLSKGTGSTVTQNKIATEASPEYIKARQDLEMIENDINYLRAYQEIFNNSHIFYRTMAKGDNI